MTRQGQLALAVLGALCIAAAAVEPTFLADNLSRGKSGAKTPVKAKASSYYGYADTEIACLNQQNFKSCRYTGCATELCGAGGASCGPTNVFVQTDFTCCPKDHKYGYGSHENIGVLGFTDKVGTCDWEISIYRWLSVCDVPVPVTTDDGTAIKLGTAWGTCYLNAEAENCDSPLCDRMAISIQGGLYISKAYGDSATPTTIANVEETCAGEDPDITLPDRRLQPGVAANSTKASSPSDGARASSPVQEVLQIILDLGSAALGCTTPDRKVAPAAASVARPADADAPSATAAAGDDDDECGLPGTTLLRPS